MLIFSNLNLASGGGLVIGALNSGTETLAHGQACTLAGSGFTGTTGTLTLRQGALSTVQTTTGWTNTSITFTASTSAFAYGPIVVEVDNGTDTAQKNVTLIPVAGKGYVVVDVPWPPGAYSVLQDASPAAADGDQIEYDLATDNDGTVTMAADGTFTVANPTEAHLFQVRAFDDTDKTWGSSVSINVVPTGVAQIITPVDGDDSVQAGQQGVVIQGWNFTTTPGTVTIGGVQQVVLAWNNTQISINVNGTTPVGATTLAVSSGTSYGQVPITVTAASAQAPFFNGPVISVPELTQNAAMSVVAVAARFSDPQGQPLTFTAVGTWPAGVTVTASSGTIQGTPTALGTYDTLRVRATDPDGNFGDSNTFSIVVAAEVAPEPPPVEPPVVAPGSGSSIAGISDVAIANLALTKLGEARIISFGDDTKAARAVTAVYELLRDAEIRRRKWRFSLRRTQLPALAVSPEFGYAYAYQLPADCLAILSVGDVAPGVDLSDYRTGLDQELYSVEGRTILTDLPAPLRLRYKARITDPTQFDAAFVQAFASRLAYELAEDLTQSATKKQAAGGDYTTAIREAVAANAIEVAPTPVNDDAWLLARI